MGALDTEGRKYLSNNTIFADAFNYLLYDGEEVIRADRLKEDADEVIKETNHRKIDRDTAFF